MTAADVAREAADVILGRAEPARAAPRDPRRPPGVRQHDEVPADGHELELRQHVQHGGGVGVPAVPADAADADPVEQLPVRPRADHDSRPTTSIESYLRGRSAGTCASSATSWCSSGRSARCSISSRSTCCCASSTRGEALFHTGWFVESLLTELVIALVVRTRRPFFRSRPGSLLLWSTVALVTLTLAIPYLPLVGVFGFVPLPGVVLVTVSAVTALYVAATEVAQEAVLSRRRMRSACRR